jgi:hypothetical protein
MKKTMKKIMIITAFLFSFSALMIGREKPVAADQLPAPAKAYINTNFAGDKVVMAILDDDVIRPDHEVGLASGVELQFDNSGALEKVASRNGISEDLIPQSIRKYVSQLYPGVGYREYEIGRHTYEVSLSNGIELKFNSRFQLVEIDD